MPSDKIISKAELELIRRIKTHFPLGLIPKSVIEEWNGCSPKMLTKALLKLFGNSPGQSEKPEPLLRLLGTIIIPATAKEFVVSKRFIEDTSSKAKVSIFRIEDSFKELFFDKIEEPRARATLCYQMQQRTAHYQTIIDGLGGEKNLEISLAAIYYLLKRQPRGEGGVLLNCYARENLLHARSKKGQLCIVGISWHRIGWYIYAIPANCVNKSIEGLRTFSRDS